MDIDDEHQLEHITNLIVGARNNGDFELNNSSQYLPQQQQFITNTNHGIAYLIVDTNFIISHLDLLIDLEQLAHLKYPGFYQIVIPQQVVQELDGLKENGHGSGNNGIESQHSLSTLARKSIDWCYSHFHDSVPTVTGQRIHERINRHAEKDDSILDCCLYFQSVETSFHNLVVLLSNDKNLCVKALVNNILTISYRSGMTAELISENVVAELQNNYQTAIQQPSAHYNDQLQNLQIPNEVCNEGMDIEDSTSNEVKEYTAYDVGNIILPEVTALVTEAVDYGVRSVYGEDIEFVGYNPNKMKTLTDASRCIVKMGISTFSEFFNRKFFDPIKILKENMQFYSTVQNNKSDLQKFTDFWVEFLKSMYENRSESQKNAILVFEKRWNDLICNIE